MKVETIFKDGCDGVTCFCCKPIDLKQRTEKPGSYKSLSQYKKDRRRGVKRNAFTWDQVAFEMEMAIGKEDAQATIKGMENMLNDPYFERDPVPIPCPETAARRMKNKNPKVLGHVWASPHPEAFHKLGYYHVWTPEGKVFEVSDEEDVVQHLMENRIKRAKL